MDNKIPRLSVIIPVYNVESYIRECLDSVLNQSFSDIEVICVDDGSTDKSGIILDEYAQRDARILVIHKENGGPVSARKAAMPLVSGKYVTFVDSDDWIDRTMYHELMRIMEDSDSDIVTSGCIREYGNTSSVDGDMLEAKVYAGKMLKDELLNNLVEVDPFFGPNIKVFEVGKLYKKELIVKYQMLVDDIIHVGEDCAVVYPCLLNARKVAVSGKNFYHYRIRGGSVAYTQLSNEEGSLDALDELLKREFLQRKKDISNAEIQYKAIVMFNRLVVMPETVIHVEDGNLVPFHNVSIADRVVIYGAGRFGRRLKKLVEQFGMIVVAVVDQNVVEGIVPVEDIRSIEFDRVIIAVLKSNLVREIRKKLRENGVRDEMISTIEP